MTCDDGMTYAGALEQVAGTVARAFVAVVVILLDLCIPNFALVLIDDISFEFKNAIITGMGCEW